MPGHSWVPFLTTWRLLERPKGSYLRSTTWFLTIFGSPWRPKNRPKIDPWLKKTSQGSFFNAFLSRMWFYSLWGSIFLSIFHENSMQNLRYFSRLRMIFSTWRTLKFIDRRDGLSTFYFFHFFWNLLTNDQKMKQNRYPQKTSKNWSRGVPEWTQNGSELVGKLQKISEICSKAWNLRDRFFDDFLDCQKTDPRELRLQKMYPELLIFRSGERVGRGVNPLPLGKGFVGL